MSKFDELEEKINILEDKRISYLEVDDKKSAWRIKKQIEMAELELELLAFNKIKNELKIYKDVLRGYPQLQNMVREKIRDSESIEKCA